MHRKFNINLPALILRSNMVKKSSLVDGFKYDFIDRSAAAYFTDHPEVHTQTRTCQDVRQTR